MPEDDAKLDGYLPLYYFRITDQDKSSRRIRYNENNKKKYEINASPENVNFGDVIVNSISQERCIIVCNVGYDYINIEDIIVTGDFNINYVPVSVLKPNEFFKIQVLFSPVILETRTGSIYIKDRSGIGGKFIFLQGNGI